MHPTSAPTAHTAKQVAVLRKQALSYPETNEEFPWGHSAFKVKGKAFVFLHADGDGFSVSVKLPDSSALALHLPFAEPTGYGLGKSGWVTARFGKSERAPMHVLSSWLEESYTAIAPKRLVKALLGAAPEKGTAAPAKAKAPRPPAAKAKASSKAPAKKRVATKPAKQRVVTKPTKKRAKRP